MGCFSCFDSSDDEKLNPVDESKSQKQSQPTLSNNNISGLPSGLFSLNLLRLHMLPRSVHLFLFRLTSLDLITSVLL